MKKVTEIINLSRIGKESRPNEQCKQWDQKTEALTLGIFARFADIFQNKCKTQGIVIYDDEKCTKLLLKLVVEGVELMEMNTFGFKD